MRSDVYLQSVLEKSEGLVRSGLWAPSPYVRSRAWLENFDSPDEQLLAATLLDNFIYFSDRATDQLLRAAFSLYEDSVLTGLASDLTAAESLLQRAVFTPIEGETPSPTDSGNLLCRRARNVLGIAEARLLDPANALVQALQGRGVVFLDDFLGSGNQFIDTWKRPYAVGAPRSFEDAYAAAPFPVHVLCLVTTSSALSRMKTAIPEALIAAAHVLDDSYSIHRLAAPPLHPPISDFASSMTGFLRRHAGALTLESYMKANNQPLYGFSRLGLMIAFEHSVPDSTLPIFWAPDGPRWTPLVRPR